MEIRMEIQECEFCFKSASKDPVTSYEIKLVKTASWNSCAIDVIIQLESISCEFKFTRYEFKHKISNIWIVI